MSYNTFTLTGTFQKSNGTADKGGVVALPSVVPLVDSAGKIILAGAVQAQLDSNGTFTMVLPTTGGNLLPATFGYTLIYTTDGHGKTSSVTFTPPGSGTTLNVADIVPAPLPAVVTPTAVTTDGLDGLVQGRINDTASATRAALSAAYVRLAALGTVNAGTVLADGTTDDAPAINTLIATLNAAGGGRLILPPGNIKLSTPIIPKNNVIIQGAGPGRTVLKPLQHGIEFSTGSAAAPLTNAHFRDFSIDGTNQTSTYKGYHGQYHLRCSWDNLYISSTQQTGLGPDFLVYCVISNCTTENTGLGNDGTQPSGNGIGIGMGGTGNSYEPFLVVGCTAINAKRFGIMVEGSDNVGGAKIIGCTATSSEAGFNVSGGSGAVLEGNYAYANDGAGFKIGTATLASSLAGRRGLCSNNVSERNTGDGFLYDATVHAPAGPGFSFIGNTSAENGGHGFQVVTTANDIVGVVIARNFIYLNQKAGIHLERTTAANTFKYCRFDDNVISENLQLGGQTYQLRIKTNMDSCTIRGNSFYYTGASAAQIYVGYTGVTNTLTNCVIEGNVTNLTTFLTRFTTVTFPGTSIRNNTGGEQTATLVGGTVTVSDSAITANSIIQVSTKTLGGTPGALYVSAKVAGTSFTITSTSATDTSVVAYEIIRY